MNNQFLIFLAKLGEASGQRTLCEAVADGYMATNSIMNPEQKLDTFRTICDTLGAEQVSSRDPRVTFQDAGVAYTKNNFKWPDLVPITDYHNGIIKEIINEIDRAIQEGAHEADIPFDRHDNRNGIERYVNFLNTSGFNATIEGPVTQQRYHRDYPATDNELAQRMRDSAYNTYSKAGFSIHVTW